MPEEEAQAAGGPGFADPSFSFYHENTFVSGEKKPIKKHTGG